MNKRILLSSLLALSIMGCTNPILNNTSQYSDLDKEYSQFKTQALTQSYLKKKMDKWLSDSKYSKNLVREIEYAKFKHPTLLKDIVALQPTMFNSITDNTGVAQKRSEPSFENYIEYIDPFPHGVTATSATNISDTSFTANWNAVSNSTGYKLYIDGSLTPITLGNVTTYNVTGLVDASSHSYYVKATNSAGESSVSNTINLTLLSALPSAPLAKSAINITSSSFTAHWYSVSNATGYKLYIDDVETVLGNVTTYNVTGLVEASSHNYYVKAINTSGESSVSNTINLTLLSAAPTALNATNITETSFTANWNAVTGATGYKLYIDGSGTPITLGLVSNYSATGLTKGTHHTYYIKAILNTGDTPNSNTISLYTISDEFKVNSYTTNNQDSPSIGMADDGKFVIAWNGEGIGDNDGGVFGQKYNSDGTTNGEEFRVNSYTTYQQQNPSVAMASDGRFVVVWESNSQEGYGNLGIYAQKYNSDGSVNGGEFRVNTYTTNNQQTPFIAMASDGKFIITWNGRGQGDSNGIYAQKYNSDGSVNGGEFRVNSYTTNNQQNQSIAMADDGTFAVSWESSTQDSGSSGIYAQLYNANGSINGGEFRVNTYTTNNQQNPAITMSDDGKFIISWESYGQDGDTTSYTNIYAQKYNTDGSSNGSEFRVNPYTTNIQSSSSIAMANDGKFIITWDGYGNRDNSVYGIYAQKYNADGSANGSEFLINTYTTNSQRTPVISIDTIGNFIITWNGNGIGDSNGIFAKRFDSNGNVL